MHFLDLSVYQFKSRLMSPSYLILSIISASTPLSTFLFFPPLFSHSSVDHYHLNPLSCSAPLPIVCPSIPPVSSILRLCFHTSVHPNVSTYPLIALPPKEQVCCGTRDKKHPCIFNQHLLNIKHWTRTHTHTHTHTHLLSRQVIQVDGLTCVCMSARV